MTSTFKQAFFSWRLFCFLTKVSAVLFPCIAAKVMATNFLQGLLCYYIYLIV
ncbi:hypothetical protein NC651_014702 [Populus alba x Populus x berolinensis]|nr:hypothetical protein NC651_014702 [Populus alba x Populus x berolinensis]